MKKTYSQNDLILEYLMQGHSLTPIEALKKFGCFRLSARCYDLRKKGYPIDSTTETKNGKTFAKYSINESYNPL